LKDYQKVAATQAEKQPDVLGAVDQAQQQLTKATQKSVSQPQTMPRSLNLRPQAPSGDRDLKPTFKVKPKTKTTPPKATPVPNPEDEFDLLNIDESADKLHQGDPVVVTAPNEFEGKTGEIYDFSPSGAFVIVDLYNHGKHSMHLSDVKYNDYADQEEADDWYDEMDESAMSELDTMRQDYERLKPDQFKKMHGIDPQVFFQKYRTLLKPAPQQDVPVEEGYQDFNKVEPYAVCLAGKPVKKFDYYEEARRFHDNWKQKLYREGNMAKAEKITLMPLNLDEMDSRGHTGTRDDYEKDRKYKGPVGTGKPATSKKVVKDLSNDFEKAFDKEKEVKEAGSPAQQAAIAIAIKKAGKKPKHMDEGADLINMSDLQFYKELLGVMVIPVAAFGAMAWNKAMNAIKLYHAEDVITALQKKGVTVDSSTLDQIKPLLLKLEQAIDVDKDGDVAKELAKRIQQAVTWGKLKQASPRTDVRTTDTELGETHEPQKYIVTINGKSTSPLHADLADRLCVAAKKSQPNAQIKKTAAPTAQRQKSIDRVKAGYGDEDALELHETRNIQNRQDFERAMDSIDRQLTAETNPVNIQILRIERKDLETRARHEGWLPIPKQTVREENSTSSEAVEIAIIRRILVAHVDLIMEFGLVKVTQAIEEVAYNAGDVDEIGTSDVSAYVHQVKQILGAE